MSLEGIMVSEINQTEEDKYCMVRLRSGILKKKKTIKLIEQRVESGGQGRWGSRTALVKGPRLLAIG